MSKNYRIYNKINYFKYNQDIDVVQEKVVEIKNIFNSLNIRVSDYIYANFIYNIGFDIDDSNERILCAKVIGDILWHCCEKEAKKKVDSGEYIIVSEKKEEFETWDEFMKNIDEA